MATYLESGGGALTALAERQAQASCSVEINQIVLGSGPLGPQPVTLSGGGHLATDATPTEVDGSFALYEGGYLLAIGHKHTGGSLTASDGGDLTAVPGATRALLLPLVELVMEALPLIAAPAPDPVPATLLITLVDDQIPLSPGMLQVLVSNGTPDAAATIDIVKGIAVDTVMSATFDETGAIGGVTVPVDVDQAGVYELVVTDTTTTLTARASFTVLDMNSAVTIGGSVITPPANVQNTVGVRKWVFQDPASSDVYHFPINPSAMQSPYPPKKILFAATTAIDGARLAFEGQPEPVQWQFEGTLLSQAEYEAFVYWLAKRNRIWLTDHYNRSWLVYLTSFQPVARRSVNHAWAHTYTMTALIFDGPVTPR